MSELRSLESLLHLPIWIRKINGQEVHGRVCEETVTTVTIDPNEDRLSVDDRTTLAWSEIDDYGIAS